MPHYIVENIEFDFTDSFGTITEQEQEFITDNTLGIWHVTEEDELVDFNPLILYYYSISFIIPYDY